MIISSPRVADCLGTVEPHPTSTIATQIPMKKRSKISPLCKQCRRVDLVQTHTKITTEVIRLSSALLITHRPEYLLTVILGKAIIEDGLIGS